MQRRSLLKLGVASAAVLVLAGGTLAWLQPGLREGRLTPAGRTVFEAVAGAILEGSLPPAQPQAATAMSSLLERIDGLIAGLPAHAQGELSQLLALLHSAPGRRAVAGLAEDWPQASLRQIQDALQDMRFSRLPLRRQAYQAMHDIVGGAYFSESTTWSMLGYPGPISL
jgi:hypothetical protein